MLQRHMLRMATVPAIAFSLVLIFLALTVTQPGIALAKEGDAIALLGNRQAMTATMPMTGSMAMTGTMAMKHPRMGSRMQIMGQMMQLMGEMQDMMGNPMPMTGTMPMTQSMAMSTTDMNQMMGLMGQLMMSHMQSMMQSCTSTMDSKMPMTGTMSMTETMPMTGAMAMTGTMPAMMNQMMQTMMSGAMPMTGTMPMGSTGSGHMMQMMGHMMQMMGAMQDMMGTDMSADNAMPMDHTALCQMVSMMNQMMGKMPNMSASHMPMGASNQSFDLLFIDSMMMHHQGAIDMAKEALTKAEHAELKQMASDIIKAQEAEIKQMKTWRTAWYPNAPQTKGMGMDMGTMKIDDDTSKPFDLRFIEAMIPHHQSAIDMAKMAQPKAEHAELKQMADDIIKAQQKEIAQMNTWKAAWFQ